MSNLLIFSLVFATLLGALMAYFLPKKNWGAFGTGAAITAFAVLVGMAIYGTVNALGQPKPVEVELRDLDNAEIFGVSLKEDQAIYVWLEIDGEPLALRFPWNTKFAENIQKAMAEANDSKGVLIAKLEKSGDGVNDAEYVAHPRPFIFTESKGSYTDLERSVRALP